MTSETALVVGAPVSLIWYYNEEPHSLIASVYGTDPLSFELNDATIEDIPLGKEVKLLIQHQGVFETANAKLEEVTRTGSRWRVRLSALKWVEADRRSHKRFPSKLLAKCRYVSETPTGTGIREFTVTTRDVSLGGAWISSDDTVPAGSILNVEISTSPTTNVKALGVVAWCDPNGQGFGVEFLDLIGSSKSSLNSFIRELAA